MPDIGFPAQGLEQFGAACAQEDGCCDLGLGVSIVEFVTDGPCQVIVFGEVGRQQKKRSGIENVGWKIKCGDRYIMVRDTDGELYISGLEEAIDLFFEEDVHGLIAFTDLVIIAVFPKDTDSHQVLFELAGAAKMRAGQIPEAAGIYL